MRPSFFKIRPYLLLLVMLPVMLSSQTIEQNIEERIYTNMAFEHPFLEDLTFTFSPEFRTRVHRKEYLLSAGTEYQVARFLEVGANYRVVYLNTTKAQTLKHYFALQSTISQQFYRFEIKGRLKFTSYAEDFDGGDQYLRFKVALKYDIFASRWQPALAGEIFTLYNDGEVVKYRYSNSWDYTLNHRSSLRFQYKWDYFMNDYKNNHIFSMGYTFRL